MVTTNLPHFLVLTDKWDTDVARKASTCLRFVKPKRTICNSLLDSGLPSYYTLHENCKEKTLIKERNGSEVQNIDQKWRISQAARWFCTATVWPRSSPLRIPTFTPSPLSPPAVSSPSDLPHPKVNLLFHLLSLFPFGLACCYESLQS